MEVVNRYRHEMQLQGRYLHEVALDQECMLPCFVL